MTSAARDAILASLRASLGRGSVFRSAPHDDAPAVPPSPIAPADDATQESLIKRFGDELRAVEGTCDVVEDADRALATIVDRVTTWLDAAGGPREVLSWAPHHLPMAGIEDALQDAGVALYVPGDLHDPEQRVKAAGLAVGITGADAAFAATGTLAFLPAEGKSRAASLLPVHHLVLLPASRLYATLEAWFAELRAGRDLPGMMSAAAQVAFVTGPSKSADIELNLTLGVHGPGDVSVIVISE